MNQKTAKRLRAQARETAPAESKLMKHIKTGVIMRGPGERRTYQLLKKAAA